MMISEAVAGSPSDAPPPEQPPEKPDGVALGKKTVRAAVWLTGSQVVSRALLMVRLIILARLLGPEELGIFGAITLALAMLELVSEIGLDAALIQRTEKDVDSYYHVAWSVTLVRGFLLGGAMYFLAPYVAAYFRLPQITLPLQVLSIAPILTGLNNNSAVALLNRDLHFNKLAVIQVGTSVAELVVGTVYALISPTVWALVAARVASLTYAIVASYWLTTYRPKFELDYRKFRELHKFGVWVFISGLITFTLTRGGDLMIGKLLPVAALGIYQMAGNLSNAITTQLGSVLTTVTFPVYSRLQDDIGRLRDAFLRSFCVTTVTVLFLTALICATANDFVAIFLDHRWADAAILMKWLSVWGACRVLGAMNSTLMQAVGKPALSTIYQVVMLVLFVILVYPMTKFYGVLGVAMMLAFIGVLVQILRYPLLAKLIQAPVSAMYYRTLFPTMAALASIAASSIVEGALQPIPGILRMLACTIVCCAVYISSICFLNRFLSFNIIAPVIELIPMRVQTKVQSILRLERAA